MFLCISIQSSSTAILLTVCIFVFLQGRNSVAIAIDSRFGLGMQTISTADAPSPSNDDEDDTNNHNGNPRILLLPNSNTLLAWTGLYGDGLGFADEMSVLLASKIRRAGGMRFIDNGSTSTTRRETMKPRAIAMLMSHLLYRRRNAPYYVEPVIVGLETVSVPEDCLVQEKEITKAITATTNTNEEESAQSSSLSSITPETEIQYKSKTMQRPFLCTTDMLGAQSTSNSFVCSGVASRSLHGTAEALWRPNLEGEELVDICGRAFVSVLERDCYSGYGAVVYLIQAKETGDNGNDESDVCILEYVISSRND